MFLTIPQAAAKLGLKRQRVWVLVDEGRIKAQQIGKMWLIQPKELERFQSIQRATGRPRKVFASG